ncbi:Imm1 family immunity protein [Nonomuraea sp. NPDC005650]|uniref:Imm1 family immunity protein n=1 Tax=Nonomuraea sp. NPDC005650 TaxID=3157045 RepID=UPI0033AE95F2
MTYHVEAYYASSHRDAPELLATPEDVDALIDTLLSMPDTHRVAALFVAERVDPDTGFPDHELYLAVNGDAGVGALKYADPAGNWASSGRPETQSGAGGYRMIHERIPFPANSDIPLDLARQAVKEFLSGGRRPGCVPWQEDAYL